MKGHFPEYGHDYSFSEFETKVLAYWSKGKIFQRSLENSRNQPVYYFYDGPPFATGLPHYGHILAGSIKDIVTRYWSRRGYHVPRRFGWDCHGLPVEFEMEKTLNLQGSLAIQDYGVDKFNEACRGIVLRYTQDWRRSVERMGRWIDMDNDYKTMDPSFMETVWWVFKELWNKGLIYEGKKVVPYSWRLTAPLSNFEASLNYKDVQDPAITVLFPLKSGVPETWKNTTALAVWTTTPWTLPANLAVAVHSDAEKVRYGRYPLPQPIGSLTHVICAQERAEAYALTEKSEDVPADILLQAGYEPLFTCYQDEDRKKDQAFRVLAGDDFVSATDGTGLVHMAPAFGEVDFYACQKAGIRLVDPTDMQAQFTAEVARDPRLQAVVGLFVKDADKTLIRLLKENHRLLKHETLQHSYPFCERSDTPLIYKAISSWFVKVDAIKDRMIAHNGTIHWVPDHIQQGRFGRWLENARDWCISRNRFWGTPIPVWRCQKCQAFHVVGSQKELEELAQQPMPDLHKHFVDKVYGDCPQCGAQKSLVRTPEVLDCWFESGSMPYAQAHYPFENRDYFEKSFPADFIAEGLDQTRGWFYTLTVLSTALFDKPAFKNCIVNGMVLAEDGKKMSKRLKNYPDPQEIFDKYGADALRLYLMQSPAMHAEELRFSEKGLLELMRAVMIPLWNAYGFFASYANIDGWTEQRTAQAPAPEQRPFLDRWILARAQETLQATHAKMEAYLLADIAPLVISFIDDLTNWYIRLNRDRFWSDQSSNAADKEAAHATLWSVLSTTAEILAPGLPFLAETLHAALHGVSLDALEDNPKWVSLHEKAFANSTHKMNLEILEEFRIAKQVILLGRSLRGEAKIGLRQPLPGIRVAGLSEEEQHHLKSLEDFVLREINIKSLTFVEQASDLVDLSIKPNFKVLGKKAGPHMKEIQKLLTAWSPEKILQFEAAGNASLKVGDSALNLDREDLSIVRQAKPGRLAQAQNSVVVELDTQLNPELKKEGLQREIINRIQQHRKEIQLHLADRIRILWWAPSASVTHEILHEEAQRPGLISTETLTTAWSMEEEHTLKGNHGDKVKSESLGDGGKFSFYIEKIEK